MATRLPISHGRTARPATVSELPNVHLGLISSRGTVDVGPGPAFYLYDDHPVVLSEVGGFALLNNRSDLNGYRATFEHLERRAVFGQSMRAQLREIADQYQDRLRST